VLSKEVFIQRFGDGEDLLREGETGDHFFLLLEGSCSVLVAGPTGGSIPVASVGPGSVVGEMALLAGALRTATVRAATEVLAARIGKEALTHVLELRPDLLESFARYAAEKSKAIDSARVSGNEIERAPSGSNDTIALGDRIRRFLGLVSHR
jgi:CRP-like cAMP-binding protein